MENLNKVTLSMNDIPECWVNLQREENAALYKNNIESKSVKIPTRLYALFK